MSYINEYRDGFLKKVWDRINQPSVEFRPRMYGSAEVVGLTPGPDFVPPVMALDSLPVEEPVVLVACLDWTDHIQIPDMDEEEAVDAIEWQRVNFGEKYVDHWFIMEVRT